MPNTVSLADVGKQLSLSPAELNFMRSSGVCTADGAHNLLTASLTSPDGEYPAMAVDRRRAVAETLAPLLSQKYKAVLGTGVKEPRGAAAPSSRALWVANDLKTSVQAQAKLQNLAAVDLVAGRYNNWLIEDQGDRQACIAFAVAACLELLRTGAGTIFPRLSPQYLYWYMRTTHWEGDRPPGWDDGATKLDYAQQVLAKHGICSWANCPYITNLPPGQGLEGAEPSAVAKAEGDAKPVTGAAYQPVQMPGTARRVYDLLAQGRPVAVAVPVYAQPGQGAVTNWSSGIASGEVLDPYPNGVFAGGHAVCVVAFQPDANGGWFTFRNSVGGNWASDFDPGGPPPRVPAAGFGAISANYVEGYCWEYLSPPLP